MKGKRTFGRKELENLGKRFDPITGHLFGNFQLLLRASEFRLEPAYLQVESDDAGANAGSTHRCSAKRERALKPVSRERRPRSVIDHETGSPTG